MKKLPLILYLLIAVNSQAQTNFFKIYDTPYLDQAFDVIETVGGGYLIVGERAYSYEEDSDE